MNRFLFLFVFALLNLTAQAQSNAPTNLRVNQKFASALSLQWTPNVAASVSYVIERSPDGRTNWSKVGDSDPVAAGVLSAGNYTDQNLSSSTTYYYRVRGDLGRNTYTSYSNVAFETTEPPPATPEAVVLTVQSSSVIQATWNTKTSLTYELERREGQRNAFTVVNTQNSGRNSSLSYNNTNLTPGTEYCFQVRIKDPVYGTSNYSAITCKTTSAPPAVPPVAPSGLNVTPISATQLQLFWTDINVQPVTFEISRADKPGGTYGVIQSDYAQKIFDDTRGLSPSTQYCYKVRAKNSAGVYSNYSNEACNSTKAAPVVAPRAPAGLTITDVKSNQVDLQWIDQSGNETGFQVERAVGTTGAFEKIQLVEANTLTFSDRTAQSNTQYCYRVQAVADALVSDYTDTKCATTLPPPPGVPVNLQATAGSPTQIDLVWTAPNAAAGDFYEVQRATSSGGNYQTLKNVPLGANGAGSFSDSGLSPNTLYCYRVRRYSAPQSDFGNESCTTTQPPIPMAPGTPARLSATAVAFDRVELSWVGVSGTETGFELEWSLDGSAWNKLATVPAPTITYAHTGLTGSTRYYYRVLAVNSIGKSPFSAPVDVVTPAAPVPPPSAPTGLTATAVLATQINLSWTNTATNAFGNDVETSSDGATNWTKLQSLDASATTYEHKGLTPATRYYYRIRASNQGGSTYSNVANAITPDVAPAAPARLSAVAISAFEIDLTWADVSTNETGFEIERSLDGGKTWDKLDTAPANAGGTATYQHKGLTPVTRYDYRVRAVNAIGKSDFSDPANATTLDVPPGAPTGLMAQAASFSAIVLTWTNSATNVTGIEILQSLDGSVFNVIATVGPTEKTYTNVGLTPATRYYYRIRAVNTVGRSAEAGPVDALTPDVAPVAPDQLVAVATSYSAVSLTWVDLSKNETGFAIEESTDGVTFKRIDTVNENGVTYQRTGLNGSTTYYYRVQAFNAIGPSGYTKTVPVTTPQAPLPSIPTNLTAVPVDFDLIKLTWSPVSTNTTTVVIERSTSSTGGFVEIGKQVPTKTEFSDVGVLPVATYFYRIKATNSAGSSDYSNLVKVDAEAIINGTAEPITDSKSVYVADRTLYVKTNRLADATIQLINLQGAVLVEKQASLDPAAPYQQAITGWPAGVYLVTVQTADSFTTKKILLP